MATTKTIWQPSEDNLKHSSMARFKDFAAKRSGRSFADYHQLYEWSVNPDTAADFWMALWSFLDLKASTQPIKAFEPHDGNMYPSPIFFPGAKMNFASSVFRDRNPASTAIIEASEGSLVTTSISWGELYSRVEKNADALRALGICAGDRVAAVVANHSYSITLCLAALSLGAIWSSVSPDFGVQGILDRVVQISPKIIFADGSTSYNGKSHNLLPIVEAWGTIAAQNELLKHIVFTKSPNEIDFSSVPKAISFDSFLAYGTGRPLEFLQLPFSQPAFIFYSSGTTGVPKCILHSAGGVMLQVRKDYELELGLLPTDIIFQYTTTAWIIWAFVLSALGTGSTVVLYTGSPVYPNVKFLPKLVAKLKVNVFGTSAKYLTDLKDSGSQPRDEYDFSSLRTVSSTGSVLPGDVATWFYDYGFPKRVHLVSGSGGTDCACAFVSGSPLLPLFPDEIQAKVLGMAVDVLDTDTGRSLEGTEEAGELVVRQPFPSQPLTFWGKGGDGAYKNSYFSMFGTNIWVQGDLIKIGPKTKGIQMLGRSDGVLNPSGVRFGSAEIYNVIRHFSEIEDSVCVGQRRPQDRDESVLLFVKLKEGRPKTKELKDQLKAEIGSKLTKRHVPRHVFYVDAIPYSIVGKKLEILVKNIVSGRAAKSNVVVNPESLMIYERFFKLEEAVASDERLGSKL